MSEAPKISAPVFASREEFEAALLIFIQKRAADTRKWSPESGPITRTTPLFETRLIDSLGIIDLIAFVERATARSIPTRLVVMKYFRSVEAIADAFWALPTGESHA